MSDHVCCKRFCVTGGQAFRRGNITKKRARYTGKGKLWSLGRAQSINYDRSSVLCFLCCVPSCLEATGCRLIGLYPSPGVLYPAPHTHPLTVSLQVQYRKHASSLRVHASAITFCAAYMSAVSLQFYRHIGSSKLPAPCFGPF
eukprot:1161092-Pelagomonas_calceolata.AAC.11